MSDYSAAPPPTALAIALREAPKVTATIIMLALAAVWLGPIILIVMTSIKSNEAFLAGPFALPTSPTLAPYFSVWASMQFGTLLAGTIVTETIFSWPGIGRLTVQAIGARDYPLMQGCILLIAFTYVLVNLLTDAVYALVDPRVRVQ